MALSYAGIDPHTDSKRALREQCLKRRSLIDKDTRDEAAAALATRALNWLDRVSDRHVIGGYMAIRNEVDITDMMLNLMETGHVIGLPVIEAPAEPLTFRAWDGNRDLPRATFGVPTPEAGCPEVEPDIVLVPMLAFDADGYRLGYGGGFYDRTLAKLRAQRPIAAIGVAFDEQELPHVPRAPHDARLDWILTQTGPRKVGG